VLGILWILEKPGALHIMIAVKPGGKKEMPGKHGSPGL
jgi:hypothetical protein